MLVSLLSPSGSRRMFFVIGGVVSGLLFAILPSSVNAFSEPTGLTPPGGTIAQPLNTSSTTQTKNETIVLQCDTLAGNCPPEYIATTPGTRITAREYCIYGAGTSPCPDGGGATCSCLDTLSNRSWVRIYSGLPIPQAGFADLAAQTNLGGTQLYALRTLSSDPNSGSPRYGFLGKDTPSGGLLGEKAAVTGVAQDLPINKELATGVMGCVSSAGADPCKSGPYADVDAWAGYFVGNFGVTGSFIADRYSEGSDLTETFPAAYLGPQNLNTDSLGFAVYQDATRYLHLHANVNNAYLDLRHPDQTVPLWLNRSGLDVQVEGNLVVEPGKSICLYGDPAFPNGDCRASWPSGDDVWQEGNDTVFPRNLTKDVLLGSSDPRNAPFIIDIKNPAKALLIVEGAGMSEQETCLGGPCT